MTGFRTVRDIHELMEWRTEVIRNVFSVVPDNALIERNMQYYRRHIADGTHIEIVATSGSGEDAGCGALCLSEELPSPDNPTGICGYLMNIYVRERYRKQGIAHEIVRKLVAEARSMGCGKIYLESTDAARSLYLSSGFRHMKNMMIYAETGI
ncbi:MAG: GNAT family N-acetyltransferase [Muribaculaceae bacterium]|nr:GNAT family N-acetyltransferase [Muribaculaceae bacterium]